MESFACKCACLYGEISSILQNLQGICTAAESSPEALETWSFRYRHVRGGCVAGGPGPLGRAPCSWAHAPGRCLPGLPGWRGQNRNPGLRSPQLRLFLSPTRAPPFPLGDLTHQSPGWPQLLPAIPWVGRAATMHVGSPRTVFKEKSAGLGVVNDFDLLCF